MSNEMIKRVAAAIAEPKARYVVKYHINGQWQIWFVEGEKEKHIFSFDQYDTDHQMAEW